jgi:hypothetical protein
MTVCVVDLLEAVDVEYEDNELLLVTSSFPKRVMETVAEEGAIGQVGERVREWTKCRSRSLRREMGFPSEEGLSPAARAFVTPGNPQASHFALQDGCSHTGMRGDAVMAEAQGLGTIEERLDRVENALKAYILMNYGSNPSTLTNSPTNAQQGRVLIDLVHATAAEHS